MSAIEIFALPVTVCEIATCNLPKWFQFKLFNLQEVGQGNELHGRRIRCWISFRGLQQGEKRLIYLKLVPLVYQRGIHMDGHTHTNILRR